MFRQHPVRARHVLPALLFAAVAAGCAYAPPHRADAGEDGAIAAGRGRIYFYRTTLNIGGPNSLLGDAMRPAVMLDGGKIAEALPGGVFFCDVMPGRHEAAVAGPRPMTVPVQVAAGGVSYLRMDWGIPTLAQRPLLEVDARTGQQETGNRDRIAATCPA
jgi:hypothetical protein